MRRQQMLSQIWRMSTLQPGVEPALNVLQHGETHQVLTHSKNGQIDSSFLIARVVPRGRSQLVESFVWLVPFVRIDRLIALS